MLIKSLANEYQLWNNCTEDMMVADREAIERARARGIADSKILSKIGSGDADAVDILKSGKKLIAGSDEWLRVRAYYSDVSQAIRDINKGRR